MCGRHHQEPGEPRKKPARRNPFHRGRQRFRPGPRNARGGQFEGHGHAPIILIAAATVPLRHLRATRLTISLFRSSEPSSKACVLWTHGRRTHDQRKTAMSTLRPHAVIPITAIPSGIFVSASESPAAARERHAAGAATAIRDHAPNARGAVHRTASWVTHQTEGRVAGREPYQVAGHAGHRAHPGPHLAERAEVADEREHSFSGLASYYSEGQHVASGGKFDASRTRPCRSGHTCAWRIRSPAAAWWSPSTIGAHSCADASSTFPSGLHGCSA
jgi:hypothetical protein